MMRGVWLVVVGGDIGVSVQREDCLNFDPGFQLIFELQFCWLKPRLQTDRETDKQTNRQRDRQRDRQTERAYIPAYNR